jgi:predicted AAA+ superfamily ATPase
VLTKEGYVQRVIDQRVSHLLGIFGAVNIEGPKWCGKTWTMHNHANSVSDLMEGNTRTLAEIDPASVLAGNTPHAIDEWQEVPAIWDAVRHEVDQSREKGRFLLTGSVTPPEEEVSHSGVGRIVTLRMHTMSLFEAGISNGTIQLKDLLDDKPVEPSISNLSIEDLIAAACKGGWPGSLGLSLPDALEIPQSYLDAIASSKTKKGKKRIRNTQAFRMLLTSLARNNASLVSNTTLYEGVRAIIPTFSADTLADYLQILREHYLLDEIPGWSPRVRSKTRMLTSSKSLFSDPSLAVAALRCGPDALLNDLQAFGGIFESLVLRDLAVYATTQGATLFHYRDNSKLEVDAILELPDSSWAAFEIKLNPRKAGQGASTLLRLKDKLVSRGFSPPRCLAVITANGIAQKREDGIYFVPVGLLRD